MKKILLSLMPEVGRECEYEWRDVPGSGKIEFLKDGRGFALSEMLDQIELSQFEKDKRAL
jgi:hypothetical protein